MGVISTTNALCQGMNAGYGGLTGPIRAATGGIDGLWNQIESGLYSLKYGTGFSNHGLLNAGVDALKAGASAYYPGSALADMNAINRLLEECAYLNGLQAVSSLLGSIGGLFGIIDDLINGLGLGGLPEFGIGGLIGSILDLLGSLYPGNMSLSGLFSGADSLINCLATLCGPNPLFIAKATEYSDDLDDLYLEAHLYDDGPYKGELMLPDLYDSIGMLPEEVTAMTIVNTGIDAVKQEALNAVNTSIAAVKTATTGGGVFG